MHKRRVESELMNKSKSSVSMNVIEPRDDESDAEIIEEKEPEEEQQDAQRVADVLELDEIFSIHEDSESEKARKKEVEKAVKEKESQNQAEITGQAEYSKMLNEKALEEESKNVLKQGGKMQTRASEIVIKDSELANAMKLSAKELETTVQLRSKGKVGENLWSNLEASLQKRQSAERERDDRIRSKVQKKQKK